MSRQALHQRVARHAILACPIGVSVVYPTWQFLDNGATIPSLAGSHLGGPTTWSRDAGAKEDSKASLPVAGCVTAVTPNE